MNGPTPISAGSDQRRTKSMTRSRTSCSTQTPVRVRQDFFGAMCCWPQPSFSHSSETGTLSTRCRLKMGTFSPGVKCFRSLLIRSLRYLNGRTLSPFPAEAEHSNVRAKSQIVDKVDTERLVQ